VTVLSLFLHGAPVKEFSKYVKNLQSYKYEICIEILCIFHCPSKYLSPYRDSDLTFCVYTVSPVIIFYLSEKRTLAVIDDMLYVRRACDKQTQDAFQSTSRLTRCSEILSGYDTVDTVLK